MYKLKNHIIRITLGIFLVALTVASASAQIVIDECDTMEFSVVSRPAIPETHFVWGIYNSSDDPVDVLDPTTTLDPALYFVDGQYAGRTVKVTGLEPGKYYVRIHVWDEINCTDNIEMYVLEVEEKLIDMELVADSVCIGDPTTIRIVFSGVGPYDIVATYGDFNTGTTINLNGVVGPDVTIPITDPLPEGETTFWVMSVTDDCKVHSWEESEAPSTGILIYPIPSHSKIYLKDP